MTPLLTSLSPSLSGTFVPCVFAGEPEVARSLGGDRSVRCLPLTPAPFFSCHSLFSARSFASVCSLGQRFPLSPLRRVGRDGGGAIAVDYGEEGPCGALARQGASPHRSRPLSPRPAATTSSPEPPASTLPTAHTLQAIRRHKFVDLLDSVGEADLRQALSAPSARPPAFGCASSQRGLHMRL